MSFRGFNYSVCMRVYTHARARVCVRVCVCVFVCTCKWILLFIMANLPLRVYVCTFLQSLEMWQMFGFTSLNLTNQSWTSNNEPLSSEKEVRLRWLKKTPYRCTHAPPIINSEAKGHTLQLLFLDKITLGWETVFIWVCINVCIFVCISVWKHLFKQSFRNTTE